MVVFVMRDQLVSSKLGNIHVAVLNRQVVSGVLIC